MKKIILTVCAITTCLISFAQIKPGMEAGFQMTNSQYKLKDVDGSTITRSGDLKPAFRGGILVDFLIINNFSIQPGIFYSMNNLQYSSPEALSIDNSLPIGNVTYDKINTNRIHTIEAPVYFLYKTSIEGRGRFFVGAGPYFSYAIAGKQHSKTPIAIADTSQSLGYRVEMVKSENNIKFGNNKDIDLYKAFNYGVGVCAGYETPVGLFFRGQFQQGLSNTFTNHDNNNDSKNWAFSFSIGIYFGDGGGGYNW